jgi:hypothetical protein
MAARPTRKMAGKTLSAGWPMMNIRMTTAAAMVDASIAKPIAAVRGVNTDRLPNISIPKIRKTTATPAAKSPIGHHVAGLSLR